MKLEVLGGCGEYGRNCFYIEINGEAILLDCGLMNDETQRLPDLTQQHVDKLQAVFLSHLHQDHVGALSLLVDYQYEGPVIVSDVTHQWLPQTLPLNFKIFKNHMRRNWQKVTDHLEFFWGYSGHVIGSTWFSIMFNKKRIFFSGDASLTSTLYPLESPPRLNYELALLDSGNVGKRTDNLRSKEQMLTRLQAYPQHEFAVTSKYTAKALELLLFFYQYTDRMLVVDADMYEWLLFHDKNHALVLRRSQRLISQLLQSERLKVEEECLQGIYFYKESTKLPGIAFDQSLNNFPFKSHLDTSEIYYLENYIDAKETLYFHSPLLNEQTSMDEILTMKEV